MNLKRTNITALILLFVLGIFSGITRAAPINVNLTSGTWLVSGVDTRGITWDTSTLIFETQTQVGDDLSLTGYFDWVGSNGSFGREKFTGTLFSNREIEMAGFEIVQPASGIVLADYVAILADSGKEIINGSWDGSGIPSNDWSARLEPVPLPAALWLFLSSVLGIGAFAKKTRP
jgi:hypothetical protein